MKVKPQLNYFQIWNMSFGFLGIQFGWGLQMANMGPIYEYLGAKPENIPILFLAAPLTGLLVQPIVGYYSDRTWTKIGRRKPYFLVGAILSTLALFIMPQSSTLWMAAGVLWILDASINISMEPFRAFVVDMLPENQHSKGFAMQSFMIGAGAVVASALPWMMSNWFGIVNDENHVGIPMSVKLSFYLGAVVFISAVVYTILTTKSYPPEDLEEFRRNNAETKGFLKGIKEILSNIGNIPTTMKQVALVQFFTWPGLFLMWFYYSTAVAKNLFEKGGEGTYTEGVEFAGLTLSFYNAITFVFALFLPIIASKFSKKITHMLCLFAGGIGLVSVAFVSSPYMLFISMTGVGIAWASILSMPYAILAPSLPKNKIGVFMGIFNFFIVLPEIIASLFFGSIMEHVLNNNRMAAIIIAGVLLLFAGLLSLRIKEVSAPELKAAG